MTYGSMAIIIIGKLHIGNQRAITFLAGNKVVVRLLKLLNCVI